MPVCIRVLQPNPKLYIVATNHIAKDDPKGGHTMTRSPAFTVFTHGKTSPVRLRADRAIPSDVVSTGLWKVFRRTGLAIVIAVVSSLTPAYAKWGGWQSLGGQIVGEPTIVNTSLNGAPLQFVAVRGTDNALWWNRTNGADNWNGWQSAGGIITSRPYCISRTPNIIDCFARDKNNSLVQRSLVNGAWNGWSSPGNSAKIKIDQNVVAMNAGANSVTVVAGAGNLSVIAWSPGTGWSNWATSNIPGWTPTNGPFDCDQRETSTIDPPSKLPVLPLEQACLVKTAGPITLFLRDRFSTASTAFPFPEIKSNYAPDVSLNRNQEVLEFTLTWTDLDGAVLRQKFGQFGPQRYAIGSIEKIGGVLTSGPSCAGKTCVGRGQDGAVWIVKK